MWNLVSLQWLGAEDIVEWYHAITEFEVLPRYIPLGRDVDTDPGLEPMGVDKNQLPQDLNVTFLFFRHKYALIIYKCIPYDHFGALQN